MKLLTVSARELLALGPEEWRSKWDNMTEPQQKMVRVEVQRMKYVAEYPTPGALALVLDPKTVQTPALRILDQKLVQVGEAIQVMYERRQLHLELLKRGIKDEIAVERAAEEIPQRGITRLIIAMPPQEGKSTRISRYGLEWFYRLFPWLYQSLVSYDGINAGRISYQIRSDIELYNGEAGNLDIGLRLMPNQKAVGRWMLMSGGTMYAIGIGGGFTGHPTDLLNIDDPTKDMRAADSVLQVRQNMEWWQTTARPRLAPWAPVMLTSTRWSENDLPGQLLRQRDEDISGGVRDYDNWEVVNIPAQADFDPSKGESDLLGRKPGEFMVSARGRTTEDWLTTKNSMPQRYWDALYQGNPTPGTGTIFLKKWWQRYDRIMWVRKPGGIFDVPGYELSQSWDFTFKDTDGTDYVVGGLIAKKGPNSYLIYVKRARLDFTSTVAEIEKMCQMFPRSRAKYVEEKANGSAVLSVLKKKISGLIAINPKESKSSRAEAGSVFIRAGNIWLPTKEVAAETPELYWDVEGFIAEHTAFDHGAHDDQVDMLSQYIKEKYIVGGVAKVASPVNGRSKPKPQKDAPLTPMQERIKARKAQSTI